MASQHLLAGVKNFHMLSSSHLEPVDVRSVYSKFPGLQQLYQRSTNKDSFFLLKLYVCFVCFHPLLVPVKHDG